MNTPNSKLQHDSLGFLNEWIIEASLTGWNLGFLRMEETEATLFRSGLRSFLLASVEELIATGDDEETKLMQGAELIESALEKMPGMMADNAMILLAETTNKITQIVNNERSGMSPAVLRLHAFMTKNEELIKRENEAAASANMGAAAATIDNIMLVVMMALNAGQFNMEKIPKSIRELLNWPVQQKQFKKAIGKTPDVVTGYANVNVNVIKNITKELEDKEKLKPLLKDWGTTTSPGITGEGKEWRWTKRARRRGARSATTLPRSSESMPRRCPQRSWNTS